MKRTIITNTVGSFFIFIFSMLYCIETIAQETAPRETGESETPEVSSVVGKPARIVSLSFNGNNLRQIARAIDNEGAKGADLDVYYLCLHAPVLFQIAPHIEQSKR